jgi:hypothetical protein
LPVRWVVRSALAAAMAAASALAGAVPAEAATTPTCGTWLCVWTGRDYTGTKVEVPFSRRYTSVSTLGISGFLSMKGTASLPIWAYRTGEQCQGNSTYEGEAESDLGAPVLSFYPDLSQGGV